MTSNDLDILAAKIAERLVTPRWLKLTQAVKYAGMGKGALVSLAQSGEISGYQVNDRGDWIIDKESIDQYHLGNMQQDQEIVAKILEKMA